MIPEVSNILIAQFGMNEIVHKHQHYIAPVPPIYVTTYEDSYQPPPLSAYTLSPLTSRNQDSLHGSGVLPSYTPSGHHLHSFPPFSPSFSDRETTKEIAPVVGDIWSHVENLVESAIQKGNKVGQGQGQGQGVDDEIKILGQRAVAQLQKRGLQDDVEKLYQALVQRLKEEEKAKGPGFRDKDTEVTQLYREIITHLETLKVYIYIYIHII